MIFFVVTYLTLAVADELVEKRRPLLGIETRIEDVPFIVSIQAKVNSSSCPEDELDCKTWKHVCTGIIVSSHHVLTGASCFFHSLARSDEMTERDPYDILVLAGSDKKDIGRRMAVSHFCYHKKYSTNSTSDSYAVIFLHDSFKFGNKVKVAKLPKGRYKDSSKQIAKMAKDRKLGYVYGWHMKGDVDNKQLLMIQVRLTDTQICRESNKTHEINSSQQFCGKPTSYTLHDIGSPLVIDRTVWGFYLDSGDEYQAPALFSRMDVALSWKKIVVESAQPSIVFHSFQNNIVIIFIFIAFHAINAI